MATAPNLPTDLDRLDPAVRAAVERATVVLTPVDDGGDDALARSRSVAVALAALVDARLVLLDRSDTTYADTPRVHQLSRDEAVGLDRGYLVDGIDEAAAAGVSATAFQHSLPGDEALTDAIDQVGADLVVVPVDLDAPGLLARLKSGDVADRTVDATPAGTTVLSVDDDGALAVAG